MKIIGLDIATTSGWASLDDGQLSDYGSIQLNGNMDLPQRLHYFHLELIRLLDRIQPEWCFIEDVILGISGAKTLSYLARLNGVAINSCFGHLQQRVKLYEPTFWKKNSFDNINGHAKKWQIQLAAVKHFNIQIVGNFEEIQNIIEEQYLNLSNIKTDIQNKRTDVNKVKASIVRKRKPLSEIEKDEAKKKQKELELYIVKMKKALKTTETEFDKKMVKISTDISAQTGITPDIADACGIAICGWKEINENLCS